MTDQTLLTEIQYALFEPPDGGQSFPSGLWTKDEVCSILTERQDRALYDTLLLVGLANIAVSIGDSLIALPADWLRTVDVVWRGNDGTVKALHRADSFEADQGISTWSSAQATAPLVYMDDDVPGSLTLRIGPSPSVAGTLELMYVPTGTVLRGNGEPMVLPDDCTDLTKYGTLASCLSKDGRGRDPQRAAYCEQRVDLAKTAIDLILQGSWS